MSNAPKKRRHSGTRTRVDAHQHPWFDDAGWEAPVAVDSSTGEIAEQFGFASVPAWVVLTDLNVVLARGTGPTTPEQLDELVSLAASSRPPA